MRRDVGNVAYAVALVDALVRGGIRHACLCPGSRSSPLAVALAGRDELRTWMHVDERAAGFFALGLARALRAPVALACSSGTAAANLLPAIVEASLSRVPLLVLTADRPPELRDVGAPQTIDQVRLYGGYAKWFVDVAPPNGTAELVRYAGMTAARAVGLARAAPSGPVHLNLPFREPLLDAPPERRPPAAAPAQLAGDRRLDPAAVAALAGAFLGRARGAIVCGPQDDPAFAPAVAALAAVLGYPIFADPLSQVRCGVHDRSAVVDRYDAFLREPGLREAFVPEVVLRFGALPTSKPLWERLAALPGTTEHVLVDNGGWRDPLAAATVVVQADATAVCRALSATGVAAPGAEAWRDRWLEADRRTRAALAEALAVDERPFEGRVFAELADLLADGTTLVAGNSMPVRDLDTFFAGNGRALRFAANRGANGIDGVVSSALGAAAAGSPVVLVLGDLSFYHDSNGLLAGRLNGVDATIVVINNDGGGIFSFLPPAELLAADRFERLFGTPTGLEPERIAEVYGATFVRAETWGAFRDAVAAGSAARGLAIVEVRTRRDDNVRRHRAVAAFVARRLRAATT